MKLTNKREMSQWAFLECLSGNDTQEMRDLITDPDWVFWYCKYVEDRPEVRKYMK